MVEKSLIDLLTKFTIPKNDLTSLTFVGGAICLMESILDCCGAMPLADNSCPANVIWLAPKMHLSGFTLRPEFLRLVSTLQRFLSCSSCVDPHIRMSSLMFLLPSQPAMTCSIFFWKISKAEFTPKMRRLYLNSPSCVTNVVISLDSG